VRGVNAGLEKSSIFDKRFGRVKGVLAGVFLVGLAPPPYIYSPVFDPILAIFDPFLAHLTRIRAHLTLFDPF